MSSAGLHPIPTDEPSVLVSPDRLAEFDRLMAQGGIEAVMEALPSRDIRQYISPHVFDGTRALPPDRAERLLKRFSTNNGVSLRGKNEQNVSD